MRKLPKELQTRCQMTMRVTNLQTGEQRELTQEEIAGRMQKILAIPPAERVKRASAHPGLRDLDLSELGISPEQAARFDRIAVEQDAIAREDQAWLDAEQRS